MKATLPNADLDPRVVDPMSRPDMSIPPSKDAPQLPPVRAFGVPDRKPQPKGGRR